MPSHPSLGIYWPLGLILTSLALTTSAFSAPILSISEFMASNDVTLTDEDGDFSDWIEIVNSGDSDASLEGYFLTDDSTDLTKWTFPAVTLAPNEYLVVFASSKNRVDPLANLHTNFKLSAGGEFLALVDPDASTTISDFSPAYPQLLADETFGFDQTGSRVYFVTPTPGEPNSEGRVSGPEFESVTSAAIQPVQGPLIVTAQVSGSDAPITEVKLYYRPNFQAETEVGMRDDGTGPDAQSGDGIWTASIPATAIAPSEMTRWRYVARDNLGVEAQEPPFRDPLDSPQYFGTVGFDPNLQTNLTVLHWFTSDPEGAKTREGSRGSVSYLGEFYDNVQADLHGQSTAFFPKKSYDFDFNKSHRFRWSDLAPRVKDIDLLTNWADKSKVRHSLAWRIMREAGVHAHFAFTVRVHQNGSFFSTADFVEDADEIYLERVGLNPEGALYKVDNNGLNKDNGDTGDSGVSKKNRKDDDNADLQALIDGLDLEGEALWNYIYDNVDIPKTINMLAANSVIRNTDLIFKNWYLCRDTGRTDEWFLLPWDLDLSGGRAWNPQDNYFDNSLYPEYFLETGTFFIRLVSQLYNKPETRSMIFRRMRTLSDQFLQPAETPLAERWYENRINELSRLIDPPNINPSDAQQDFEKWGSWLNGQNGAQVPYNFPSTDVESMEEGLNRWRNEYLPARRNIIYNQQTSGNGGEIPLPQTGENQWQRTTLIASGADAEILVPSDGSLGASWQGTPTDEPFDTSAWTTGPTGVGYERSGGYETLIGTNVNTAMQNSSSVYLRIPFRVGGAADYQQMELRIKRDDGFAAYLNGTLVASANAPIELSWNSSATNYDHEASVSAFEVFDISQHLSLLQEGDNILAIQGLNHSIDSSDLLILPELSVSRPSENSSNEPTISFGEVEFSPTSGNQAEEYIVLSNQNSIAVDISEWTLEGAIAFTFQPGTVIPADTVLYLSPDVNAFRARSTTPSGGQGLFLQGAYEGRLSSFGGTLILKDADGLFNNATTYQGNPSDNQRYLKISEMMYNPDTDALAEYIELVNTSEDLTLDLSTLVFTAGIDFDFAASPITSLAPGGRVLIVQDIEGFRTTYGESALVAGQFLSESKLSNGGEVLALADVVGTIFNFEYDDKDPWPTQADGDGYSLIYKQTTSSDLSNPADWRLSSLIGGNPGETDTLEIPPQPSADQDGNDRADLLDYALGEGTEGFNIDPFATTETGNHLVLTYAFALGADSATIAIEESPDLKTWQDASADFEEVEVTPLGDGRALATTQRKTTTERGIPCFFRLRVTTP